MRRAIGMWLLLLGGCDKLLSIDHVGPSPDAAPDAPPDAGADLIGCADGTREWLVDRDAYPQITGCAGGWTIAGVHHPMPPSPLCPAAGNDNPTNPNGSGCDVSDLCASGWHVCQDPLDVDTRLAGKACKEATGLPNAFFVTGVHSNGVFACETTGNNDLFGCGSIGLPAGASCGGIDRASGDGCSALPFGWNCGNDGLNEALNVTKTVAVSGGALCCQN